MSKSKPTLGPRSLADRIRFTIHHIQSLPLRVEQALLSDVETLVAMATTDDPEVCCWQGCSKVLRAGNRSGACREHREKVIRMQNKTK